MKNDNQLFKYCRKTGRAYGVNFSSLFVKLLFPLFGIIAIIWFLVRVIPKPSRMTYPCQQFAAGIGGSVIVYLLAGIGSLHILRKKKGLWVTSVVAMVCIVVLSTFGVFAVVESLINPEDSFVMESTHPEKPNTPMGKGKGLFPGRVAWVRDRASTDWDGNEKSWWDDKHTDQNVVSEMFSTMLQTYTEQPSDKAAWDALFKHFNKTRQRGDAGYKPGEKIVIKLNCNHDKKSYEWDNEAHPSPAVIYALVAQLIEVVGVSGDDITLAEPSQLIGNPVYNKIRSNPNPQFQKVWFADKYYEKVPQRIYAEPDKNSSIYFMIKETPEGAFDKKIKFNLPQCYTDATYLINLSILRGHRVFGVTLAAKNHYGSIFSEELNQYSPGKPGSLWNNRPSKVFLLHCYSLWDYQVSNKLGDPSFAPVFLGHKDLGGKEMLYLIDGIFTSKRNETGMIKFKSLDDDWCSSLLISQDPVAIQSVGTDILCDEPNLTDNNPSFIVHLDNFLQESALAANPPSGFKYDPEDDGDSIKESLGVHEHWNNSKDRMYSRNLGKDEGIELIMRPN